MPPFVKTLLSQNYNEAEKAQLKCYLDEYSEHGSTALMIATKNALFDVVKMLHQAGADIHAVNKMGHSAIHVAAYNKPERTGTILHYLLEHHANILAKNKVKQTILEITEKMAYEDMYNELLPLSARAEIWAEKNCIFKLYLHKERTKFKKISNNVFREIIKYA